MAALTLAFLAAACQRNLVRRTVAFEPGTECAIEQDLLNPNFSLKLAERVGGFQCRVSRNINAGVRCN